MKFNIFYIERDMFRILISVSPRFIFQMSSLHKPSYIQALTVLEDMVEAAVWVIFNYKEHVAGNTATGSKILFVQVCTMSPSTEMKNKLMQLGVTSCGNDFSQNGNLKSSLIFLCWRSQFCCLFKDSLPFWNICMYMMKHLCSRTKSKPETHLFLT